MTNEEKLAVVTAMANKHLETNAKSVASAKRALVREGFYTTKGDLSPNYGGLKPIRKTGKAKADA